MEECGWQLPSTSSERKTDAELKQMREKIDDLDRQIAILLDQRLQVSRQVGQLKADSDMPVKDQARENEVLTSVSDKAADAELAQSMKTIYQAILTESCRLQKKKELRLSPSSFPSVLIVGLGLVGGALARQIKRLSPSTVVLASDLPEVLNQGLKEGIIDDGAPDALTLVSKAALVVLAAPPSENLRLLEKIAPKLKRRQVVVDLTSTKASICTLADSLAIKSDFVGGHPLFGSEKSGLTNSAALNIDGATFCIVPTTKSSEFGLRRLTRWLTELKLDVKVMDAERHDRSVALTSHLVQLLAVALGSQIQRRLSSDPSALELSGPALRSLSRLMASPSPMWLDICHQNRQQIASTLKQLEERVADLRQAIESDDQGSLTKAFEEAQQTAKILRRPEN
jgi:prephenate dehydrogenase